MNYGEFFFFYMLLPWAIAIIAGLTAVVVLAIGGSELRTIISAKLDGACQLVLAWVDGGQFKLVKYYPWEHGIMKNGNNFIQYTTPLTDLNLSPGVITFAEARKQVPKELMDDNTLMQKVKEQNEKNEREAAERGARLGKLNEDVKAKGTWLGRPLWIGHLSIGVATTPQLLARMTEAKRPKGEPVLSKFEPTSIDIKDYLSIRFSPVTLFSILRAGEDYGRYGRPHGKFPTIIIIILMIAIGLGILGFLILSGKLDVSGFVKGLGLGV